MRTPIFSFALGLLALCAPVRAANYKISDLPITTAPSTNTFIEVADMNEAAAADRSRKYLLTNLAKATQASIWTNAASRVRLVTTNANSTLELQANDGASGGTTEFWTGGTKRWSLNNGGTFFPEANYDIGTSVKPVQTLWMQGPTGVALGDRIVSSSTGDPEGARTGPVGSLFLRSDGSAGSTLYTKVSGVGNTGWQPIQSGTSGLYVLKAGDTMTGTLNISPAANTMGLSITNYSKTDSNTIPMLDISGTWNNGTGTNTALKVNVTDTASGASSSLLDLQVGGTSKFKVDKAGAALLPDGSVSAPSLTWASDADGTGTGAYRSAANQYAIACNGVQSGKFTTAGLEIKFDLNLNWNGDLVLMRDTAAVLQLGQDAATATAQTIKAHDGTGTDKAGASLTLEGGQGTGTGTAGSLILRTGTTGAASASTANAYQDRARYIPKYVTLTDGVATSIFTVTLPATNTIGMSFTCTVQAGDATDFQSLTTLVTVDAVAKTTTITPVVAPTAAQTALAGSAGTLSVTYSVADAGSNVLAVKCLADTSLTSTYLRAKIVLTGINMMGAGVVINEL